MLCLELVRGARGLGAHLLGGACLGLVVVAVLEREGLLQRLVFLAAQSQPQGLQPRVELAPLRRESGFDVCGAASRSCRRRRRRSSSCSSSSGSLCGSELPLELHDALVVVLLALLQLGFERGQALLRRRDLRLQL